MKIGGCYTNVEGFLFYFILFFLLYSKRGSFREGKEGNFWFFGSLNYLAWVLITKCHRLDGLNNRNLFSHSSGGWKSKVRVPIGPVSTETSLLGLRIANLLLCLHMGRPLCATTPHVASSSYRDTRPTGWGPTCVTSFNGIPTSMALFPNLEVLGLRTLAYFLGEHNSTH